MNPVSSGAIFGQRRYKVVPPEEVSGEKKQPKNEKEQEQKKEVNELAAIASLQNHPGWILMEQKMRKRIEAFKSGSYLVDPVAQNVDTTKLGEMLKDEMRVAAQLESFITEVNIAYQQIELEKEERRREARRARA